MRFQTREEKKAKAVILPLFRTVEYATASKWYQGGK